MRPGWNSTTGSRRHGQNVRQRRPAGRDGSAVWPVLWSDNYVSILPGLSRELAVRYESSLLGGAAPVVQVEGLNVPAQRTDN